MSIITFSCKDVVPRQHRTQNSSRTYSHLLFPRSPFPPAAAVATAAVKLARPRSTLDVLQAHFSSCFELMQSTSYTPAPANPATYLLCSRVHTVIPRGLFPSQRSLEVSQEHMAKLRPCVLWRMGRLPARCSSSKTNLSVECASPCHATYCTPFRLTRECAGSYLPRVFSYCCKLLPTIMLQS